MSVSVKTKPESFMLHLHSMLPATLQDRPFSFSIWLGWPVLFVQECYDCSSCCPVLVGRFATTDRIYLSTSRIVRLRELQWDDVSNNRFLFVYHILQGNDSVVLFRYPWQRTTTPTSWNQKTWSFLFHLAPFHPGSGQYALVFHPEISSSNVPSPLLLFRNCFRQTWRTG